MLHYHITPASTEQHLWQIRLQFEHRGEDAPVLSLPNWVPGSYMIRNFARHIVRISARCNDENVSLHQTGKNQWQAPPRTGHWQIDYQVYAFDLSVRGSFLSRERAFFDGACLLLRLHGRSQEACQLQLALPQFADYATSLTPTATPHLFQAANYADLIDHPLEAGKLLRLPFEAGGIAHEIVISGHHGDFDAERLVADVAKICAAQLAFFPSPQPFDRYLFLLHVGDKLYGGLEHRNSTALLADRHSLPRRDTAAAEAYIGLLGLFSHEYFHAWNVKSIKPAAFAESDLETEAYSEQLWAFEGITAYYDDLFLVRSGVITPEQYLKLLAQNLTRVQQTPGRTVQTLAESSFNAWTKYYLPNENSPNTTVSYYQQGALMALCLDAHIRSHSRHSLDTVMRMLYADFVLSGQPLAEGQWQQRAQEITGLDLQAFFQAALHTTDALPLAEALSGLGVGLIWHALPHSHGGNVVEQWPQEPAATADFGARFRQQADGILLTHVLNGGSAEAAGLCAGDLVIALDQFACTDFAARWQSVAVGQIVMLHYFRHGVLQHTSMRPQAIAADTALLKIEDHSALAEWLWVR